MYELNTEAPTLPSFDIIADALMPLGALNSPSELHGALCGHLCAGGRYSANGWMVAAWEMLDVVAQPDRDLDDLIADLYVVTVQQLNDGNMSFEMLLPQDHVPMEQRLVALSQWCHGFLMGFGSTDRWQQLPETENPLSIDLEETLSDFAAFVQLQSDQDEEQDSEADYHEIVEYVRIATMNIFMDIGIRAENTNMDFGEEDETLH